MTVKINARYVRTLLLAKGMTVTDLADATGVSRQTIYNIMGGKPFTNDTLGKMAEALGTTPSRLISTGEVAVQLQPEI